jgi:hypothetical protein
MATNIDRALFQQPTGIEVAAAQEQPLEIEVIEPGFEIEMEVEVEVIDPKFADNLAEDVEPNVLTSLASELSELIDNDKNSRKEWEKTYVEGLKLLGLQYEERTQPWDGACGVFHPMITEAVVRFQSDSITESFPAQGPVRTKIIGKETPAKKASAKRVEDDMNNELTEVMLEFRPEHERMLWSLPATGSAFKKVYYDPGMGRQVSMFVPAEDILLPYGTSDVNTCYRVTHVMRKTENDIKKLQKAGFYRDFALPTPSTTREDIAKAKDKETGFTDVNDDRFVLYECHVDLDLEGYKDKDEDGEETGIALPYVVTMIKGTNEVLAIRRNWLENDENRLKRQHFVHYQYIPGFGAYGFGLFHLIGGFAKSATSIIRQLVDAGTLSNLPGGLKSRGLRIKGDDTPISPGEFRDVDIGSGALRDNILPLPYKEPSQVLAGLLGTIVDEGRRIASTADMNVSDMSAQAPVGTTLALLERQLKIMSAVQARMHYSLKQELKLLAAIIRDYTDDDYEYDPETADRHAKQADYDAVDIIPVSDPNAATMSQRVVQYQAVIQMAQMSPDIYDLPYLHRQMLEVLGIKHAEKLVPLEDDEKPIDPVQENMAVLKGKPVKAFMQQNHDAHIQVHMSMMQDPLLMQLIGQNPKAPMMQASMMAHIAEHAGFKYRQQIEQTLGIVIPDESAEIPPEMANQLAAGMAQAGQRLLQQSQQQAAQQQAQQAAQDPVLQMQQKEQVIAEKELGIKERKLMTDAAQAASKLELEREVAMRKLSLEERKLLTEAADKSGKLQLQADGNNPALAMQQHNQTLRHKQEAHQQSLAHQREQNAARIEAARMAAASKPTKPEDKVTK